jgi:hypothetical protein
MMNQMTDSRGFKASRAHATPVAEGASEEASAVPNFFTPYSAVEERLAQMAGTPAQDQVKAIIRLILDATPIDEALYLRRNPDVAQAVAAGVYASARDHLVAVGYFEGRSAWPERFDEAWYLNTYPDVAEGIASGALKNGKEHFERFGAREGRLPAPIVR